MPEPINFTFEYWLRNRAKIDTTPYSITGKAKVALASGVVSGIQTVQDLRRDLRNLNFDDPMVATRVWGEFTSSRRRWERSLKKDEHMRGNADVGFVRHSYEVVTK